MAEHKIRCPKCGELIKASTSAEAERKLDEHDQQEHGS